MRKNLLPRLALFLGLLVLSVTARAGTLNDWGRYFGWGWSDGYHARPAAAQPRAEFGPYMPGPGAPSISHGPCADCHPFPGGGTLPADAQPAARKAGPAPVMSGRLPALPSRQAQPRIVPLPR